MSRRWSNEALERVRRGHPATAVDLEAVYRTVCRLARPHTIERPLAPGGPRLTLPGACTVEIMRSSGADPRRASHALRQLVAARRVRVVRVGSYRCYLPTEPSQPIPETKEERRG